METGTFYIGGMTCAACQIRIETKLKNTAGIETAGVNFSSGTANLAWDPSVITFEEIKAAVESLGYTAGTEKKRPPAARAAGTAVVILALYLILLNLGPGFLASFPLAGKGMGYGMIFITGLITSLHCAAMCGGINLSQTLGGAPPSVSAAPRPLFRLAPFRPGLLYNGGRVLSYTAAGIAAGALGRAVSPSGRFQGAVQLAAGAFMVILGINMLGIFPVLRRLVPRLPGRPAGGGKGGRRPLAAGLLNGLMPCGPLQAMQLYALSAGSPAAGGLAMFLFGMGTVPLMLGIGAAGSFLSGGSLGPAFTRRVTGAGAVIITVMGMAMFSYGWTLSALGSVFTGSGGKGGRLFTPEPGNGVQIVNSVLSGGQYPAITVRQGIPVRWTINAPEGSINGCNNRMIIREYGIEHRFQPGENLIEFMPERAGRIPYSCWMGMIRSSITVTAEDEAPAGPGNGGPVPAGAAVSPEAAAFARISGGIQTVTIGLRDDGIEPAIVVVQRGIPVLWTVNNDSLDPGNSSLLVPAYAARIAMGQGDNTLRFTPSGDFDFSTADHVFYGYVKVVEDLGKADPEAIRAEAAGHETLIYPESYFETPAEGFEFDP